MRDPLAKMALNAEFPVLGAKYTPLYKPDLAQRVTDNAQKLLISGTYGKIGRALPQRHPATSIGE